MGKKVIAIALALVLLCAVPVSATHEVPDEDRLGSISITMTYQGEPVPGGTLTLYRVADVATDNGDYFFVYTEDYAECTIPVTELNSAELPQELAQIAGDKDLDGATQDIADDGTVVFSDLPIGLYLLVQEEAASGFNKVNPFLVSVPYYEDGQYVYDVDASPKLSLERAPTEPTEPPTEPSEPTTPPELPQTGLNQWPVPVLTISGLLFVVMGLVIYKTGKKKSYES